LKPASANANGFVETETSLDPSRGQLAANGQVGIVNGVYSSLSRTSPLPGHFSQPLPLAIFHSKPLAIFHSKPLAIFDDNGNPVHLNDTVVLNPTGSVAIGESQDRFQIQSVSVSSNSSATSRTMRIVMVNCSGQRTAKWSSIATAL
jgi:hypothetical protein